MTCHNCEFRAHRHGKDRKGNQRFRCPECKRTFSDAEPGPLGDMRLPMDKARLVLHLLVEGNSVRSTERITGVHRDTILRLLCLAGERAASVMDRLFRNLHLDFIQADEIWAFVGCKEKRRCPGHPSYFGSQFVFVALDSETKLVPSFKVGRRNATTAYHFMRDLAGRLASKPQLSTDGFRPYVNAVEATFGGDVDFAQLIKMFQSQGDGGRESYAPSRLAAITKHIVCGRPDEELVSTSHVERQNLTMRMGMRRLTRLTNGFSKSLDHLKAAVALHFGYYNLCRPHTTLAGVTPAMEAGLTGHIWGIEELLST